MLRRLSWYGNFWMAFSRYILLSACPVRWFLAICKKIVSILYEAPPYYMQLIRVCIKTIKLQNLRRSDEFKRLPISRNQIRGAPTPNHTFINKDNPNALLSASWWLSRRVSHCGSTCMPAWITFSVVFRGASLHGCFNVCFVGVPDVFVCHPLYVLRAESVYEESLRLLSAFLGFRGPTLGRKMRRKQLAMKIIEWVNW